MEFDVILMVVCVGQHVAPIAWPLGGAGTTF